MESLLPSIGSMAMAGVKGSEPRSFSSSGLKTTAVGVSHGRTFGFGGGASSVSIGGGSSLAGAGATSLIVRISDWVFAAAARPEGVESQARTANAARKTRRLIREDLLRSVSQFAWCPGLESNQHPLMRTGF